MEKDEGWVLNLERRDRIMNINIISLSVLINELCYRFPCAHSDFFFIPYFLTLWLLGFCLFFLSFGSGFV